MVWQYSTISQSVMRKSGITAFKVKVTVKVPNVSECLSRWYLLNHRTFCWLVCNQTWFDSTASQAGVSCGKMELLHLRSRWQRRFKMSANVCLEGIFWITEHFVTKSGTVMQHHEPVSCGGKYSIYCYLQELIWSKYNNFHCIFWSAHPFATKLGLIVHYHKPECFIEKLYCYVQGQGQSKFQNINECLPRWYFLNCWTFLLPDLVWWCIIMSQIVFQKDWFAVSRSRSQLSIM